MFFSISLEINKNLLNLEILTFIILKKAQKFILVTIWILLSRAYDAWSTYHHTPDLTKEANPMVSALGMGWIPLLTTIGLLSTYIIYAFYQSTFNTRNLHPQDDGFNFRQFAAYFYLGERKHWSAMLYQMPREKWRLHQYMGRILPPCLAFAGLLSTLMWLLIQYYPPYHQYHSPTVIYSILIFISILLIYRINQMEFREYQSK